MGISLDSLEKFVAEASFSGSSPWLRPRPNDGGKKRMYNLRLCPPRDNGDQPFFTTKQHYIKAGGETLNGTCPRAYNGSPCPACKIFFDLFKVIDRDNEKAFWNAARKLGPTDRFYANFVDRDSGDVKIWSMSYNVFTNLKDIITQYLRAGKDISNPDEGRDFAISVSKKGAVQEYGGIIPAVEESPIGVENWEGSLHNLEELAHSKVLKAEDIEEILPEALGEFYEEAMKRLDTEGVGSGLLD